MHIADRVMAETHWVDYDQDETADWYDEFVGDFAAYVWLAAGLHMCGGVGFVADDVIELFSRDELELLYAQYLMEKEET